MKNTGIRIEQTISNDLSRAYLWLSRHRSRTLDVHHMGWRLAFGIPMSAARAIICAVSLHGEEGSAPVLGGVLHVISNRADASGSRLVFDGRSPARLDPHEAHPVAREMLSLIAERIATDDLVAA